MSNMSKAPWVKCTYRADAAFHPRVFDVRVRELYRLHYHEKAFNCMRLRMGWHAKEDLK